VTPFWDIDFPGVPGGGIQIADRFIRLRLVDKDGFESDLAEIEFGAEDLRGDLPSPGEVMRVQIGWQGGSAATADYRIESYRLSGPPAVAVISGFGANLAARADREVRTETNTFPTTGAAFNFLAARNNLRATVSADFAALPCPVADSSGNVTHMRESDISLMQRIADRCGGILKFTPTEVRLLDRRAALEAPIVIDSLSRWGLDIHSRPGFAAWRATYLDVATGAIKTAESAPAAANEKGGARAQQTRKLYPNRAAAEAAARSARGQAQRAHRILRCSLSGNPDIRPDVPIKITTGPPDIRGVWLPTQVTQQISKRAGFTTKLTASPPESPPANAPAAP